MKPKRYIRRLRDKIKGPHCSHLQANETIVNNIKTIKKWYNNGESLPLDEAASKLKRIMYT